MTVGGISAEKQGRQQTEAFIEYRTQGRVLRRIFLKRSAGRFAA
jgi:hypothetical protein